MLSNFIQVQQTGELMCPLVGDGTRQSALWLPINSEAESATKVYSSPNITNEDDLELGNCDVTLMTKWIKWIFWCNRIMEET